MSKEKKSNITKTAFQKVWSFSSHFVRFIFFSLERVLIFLIRMVSRFRNTQSRVLPYTSYGNKESLRVFGRAVEISASSDFLKSRGRFHYFWKVVRLFFTPPLARVTVDVFWGESFWRLATNSEGFFNEQVFLSNSEAENDVSETQVQFQLSEGKVRGSRHDSSYAHVYRPTDRSDCLVVSDIDDTILKSRATNIYRLAFKTLFYPIQRRKSFPQTSDLYQNLRTGWQQGRNNLFFYVSSSSWNLYPLLKSFLYFQKFPDGPLLLQDLATERRKSEKIPHQHKMDRIEEILEMYPELPIVLIGDAGQADAEIYLSLAESYKERVKVILIRKSWWTEKVGLQQEYLERAEKLSVPFYYFDNIEEVEPALEKLFLTSSQAARVNSSQ